MLGFGDHGYGGHGWEGAEDAEGDGDALVQGRDAAHCCVKGDWQQDHFYENCRVDLLTF